MDIARRPEVVADLLVAMYLSPTATSNAILHERISPPRSFPAHVGPFCVVTSSLVVTLRVPT